MPELPEVETMKNGIEKYIVNQRIIKYDIFTAKLRYYLEIPMFDNIKNQKILNLFRRGKHIIISLGTYSIIVHFGMTGTIKVITNLIYLREKHDHLIINLTNRITLVYNDPRKFGYWIITKSNPLMHKCLANHGIEPLNENFNGEYLMNKISRCKTTIKQALMNNKILVGVGNIYACESLFLSRINPMKSANSITKNECYKIVDAIKKILKYAIKKGGTTLKDYKDVEGRPGYFSLELNVYGRKNVPCKICSTPIQSNKIGQRATFYCENCQVL